jgi:hypothetical protein
MVFSATGSRNVVFPSPIREEVAYTTGVETGTCRDRRLVWQPHLPAPRDGSGHAQSWRTADGSVFASVGSSRRWWKRNAQFPSNTKENRLVTAAMDMKQSRTETRRRLVPTPSNPERGPGWPPLNKVESRQDSRIWWRWVLSRWNGESRSSLSPKKARENAQNKPVMVAYLDLAIITKV